MTNRCFESVPQIKQPGRPSERSKIHSVKVPGDLEPITSFSTTTANTIPLDLFHEARHDKIAARLC